MIETQKISGRQIFFVIVASAYAAGIYYHSLIIRVAGRGILPGYIPAGAALILLSVVIWYLSKDFPQKTIFQILEINTCRFVGHAFSMVYAIICLVNTALLLRIFAGLVSSFILIHTPAWFSMLMILIIGIFIASKSMEVQARLFTITQPFVVSLFTLGLSIGLSGPFEISNLLPVFDTDLKHIIQGSYLNTAAFVEIILNLFVFTAALGNTLKSLKIITVSITFATILIPFITSFLMIGILGVDLASRVSYEAMNVTLNVGIGDFVQGIEIFLLTIFEILAISKVTLNIYCAAAVISHTFKNIKMLIIVSASSLTVFASTFFIKSVNEAFYYVVFFYQYIALPFTVFVLSITLIAALIARRKRVYK